MDEAGAAPPAIWKGEDVLLISFASLILLLAGTLGLARLVRLLDSSFTPQNSPSLLLTALLSAVEPVALVGSVYLFGIRRRRLRWSQLGLCPPSSRWWWSTVFIAIVFIPLMGLIALVIRWLLGRPLENPQLNALVPETFTWPGAIAMILLVGLAVPFAEELFFRGVLYRWMRSRWGFWTGLLASSLVFGLLHVDLSLAGATFIMGLALGWIYERSQSLWPSILIHAFNNTMELVLLYTFIASGVSIPGIH
jgi:membrane protease YdiL (CAAX protease family)